MDIRATILSKLHRLTTDEYIMYRKSKAAIPTGNGEAATRKLDIVLISLGFKLSGPAIRHLNKLKGTFVDTYGRWVLDTIGELIGNKAQHNVYFRSFPNGIPDTHEFWRECIANALLCDDIDTRVKVVGQLFQGRINLLDLPMYGKYLHTYEEMLAEHEVFMPGIGDRTTIIELGGSCYSEMVNLYTMLGSSTIPLNDSDKVLLGELASTIADPPQFKVPVRENRAIINQSRLVKGLSIEVDTVTDILRLACSLSGGDVTLETNTKFKSFPRRTRQIMMETLDSVVKEHEYKLGDVTKHAGKWKRLSVGLHPHEYVTMEGAQKVFQVARGELRVDILGKKVEAAMSKLDTVEASRLLKVQPGVMFRSADRLLRNSSSSEVGEVVRNLLDVANDVSGKVIISFMEHLNNRHGIQPTKRIFTNRKGKTWVTDNTLEPMEAGQIGFINNMLGKAIAKRLPEYDMVVVENNAIGIALPLSNKNVAEGFSVLPRGSELGTGTSGGLRVFMHWMQHKERTDYDLSLLTIHADGNMEHVSFTRLKSGEDIVHSGDITDAPKPLGATEFVDIDLDHVGSNRFIGSIMVPQIQFYHGEKYSESAECYMGFMDINRSQMGKPFEPSTVVTKSEVRGEGEVALPFTFVVNQDGVVKAKWLNMFLKGSSYGGNTIETNRMSVSLLVKTIVARRYMTVGDMCDLYESSGAVVALSEDGIIGKDTIGKRVLYIGLSNPPYELGAGSKVVTPANLSELIPT